MSPSCLIPSLKEKKKKRGRMEANRRPRRAADRNSIVAEKERETKERRERKGGRERTCEREKGDLGIYRGKAFAFGNIFVIPCVKYTNYYSFFFFF